MWTISSPTTGEEPLATWIGGSLSEKYSEINLFLIPVIWEETL